MTLNLLLNCKFPLTRVTEFQRVARASGMVNEKVLEESRQIAELVERSPRTLLAYLTDVQTAWFRKTPLTFGLMEKMNPEQFGRVTEALAYDPSKMHYTDELVYLSTGMNFGEFGIVSGFGTNPSSVRVQLVKSNEILSMSYTPRRY